jgi:hypothetical protein
VKKAIDGILKISLQVDVEDVIARKAVGHLPEEPAEPVISLNVKIWIVKSFIA